MDDEFAHQTMRYTLTKVAMVTTRHEVYVCIERQLLPRWGRGSL